MIVTSCTGFSAPGLDFEVIDRCGLPAAIERTMIGFMGCYAAINALKLARHIVRSEPQARVLVLNLELCTLHLQETTDLAQMLCFLLFSDGCAASLVTAEPGGIALDSFRAMVIPDTRTLMSWHIRNLGFDMVLAGQVPAAIHDALRRGSNEMLASAPVGARSTCGRCTPAAARCSTRSSARSTSHRQRSRCRARCCAASATCRRQP